MSITQSLRIPQSPIPEVLYKYCPPERIDILEGMQIRFSSPSQFNDTFDSHYLVPTSQGAKGKTARTLLRNRLGILSLTERRDNHLMWVHYARNHTGFVLGFDARASFFQEDDHVLRKVIYEPGPRVHSEADVNVCFYKSNEWEYEQEWRCVRSFQSSESRMIDIDPSLITQTIFGSRMESWQIARILVFAQALEAIAHTQFFVSTPSRSSWTMETHSKTMSLCTHCDGSGYLMQDQLEAQPLKAKKS
jgi:hypothetical protein